MVTEPRTASADTPDRRTRRLASGALRPATATGVPRISTPIRDWSTEQMLADMRGARR